MNVLSSLEPFDFLTRFPASCSLTVTRLSFLSSSSRSLSHEAAGDQIFDLNLLSEDDAEAAAATSEFMREVKGVAEAAEWREDSLGEEGYRLEGAGADGGMGEEGSSLRTHRSSGESGEFPSDDREADDMANTVWLQSV